MIFLTATDVPDSWSFAELHGNHEHDALAAHERHENVPNQAESSHSDGL